MKNKKINNIKKAIALVVLSSLLIPLFKINVKADSEIRKNIRVIVDGAEKDSVMALEANYDNDLYLSMRGIARALNGTNGAFNPVIEDNKISIETGVNYDGEISAWTLEETQDRSKMTISRYEMEVNGQEKKYYSMIGNISGGIQDAFFRPVTLAMMLDLNIEITDEGVVIDTSKSFIVKEEDLKSSGIMQGTNAVLIGDGTTGEIYFEHDSDEIVPIASTTKIMTYLLVMEAVNNGDISLEDNAYITQNAVHMADGIDGVIKMTEGDYVPVRELIDGMLLKSSNECAIVLAEHVAGSEEEFVKRMNNKAKELGLENAEFYNCNGVPVFDQQLIPAKMQNHMTAMEMFKLASEMVNKYPEVLNITSVKAERLSTLGVDIKTTNNVMYNIEEVKGLKTGTTNKSGACLVECIPLQKNDTTHYIFSLIFGTEGELDRSTFAEITARYAIDRFNTSDDSYVSETVIDTVPLDPDSVVNKIVSEFLKKQESNEAGPNDK